MKNKVFSAVFSLLLMACILPMTAFADNVTEVIITAEDVAVETETKGATTALENALTRMILVDTASEITALKITTAENVRMTEESLDNYFRNNMPNVNYLDLSDCKFRMQTLSQGIIDKSNGKLTAGEYETFGYGLWNMPRLETLILPKTVEVIGSYAITGTKITSINIPDSVKVIDGGGFNDNLYTTGDIIIPDSVVYIGNNAFGNSSVIESGLLKLGNSVTFIHNNGFKNRKFKGDLIIPDSVIEIGQWTFCNGQAFVGGKLVIGTGLKTVNSGNTLSMSSYSEVILKEGQTAVPAYMNNGTNVTKLTLPSTLTTIRNSGFSGYKSLPGVYVPRSVTSVGTSAFINMAQDSVIYVADKNVESLFTTSVYTDTKTAIANLNGGYFEDSNFTAGQLKTPKKDDYIFAGWYDNDRFTGTPVTTATPGTTYYAKWVDSKITFDGNGADRGTMEPQFADIGDTIAANTYYLTGYELHSWNTKPDGTGTRINAGGQLPAGLTGEITLYAQWAKVVDSKAYYVYPVIADQVYTGEELKPDVYVECDGVQIALPEYDVEYTNNINAGTSTAVVKVNNTEIGTAEFKINQATQDISYAETAVSKLTNDTAFTNTLTKTKVFGTITYESSNPAVATVDKKTGEVTILTDGITTITAIAEGTNNYTAAKAEYTLTVKKYVEPTPEPTPVVTPTPAPQEEVHTPHQHSNLQWVYTETEHWQTCTHCIERVALWVHDYTQDNPDVCRLCGYTKVKVPATQAGAETEEDVAQPTPAATTEPAATPQPTAEPAPEPTVQPTVTENNGEDGLPILPVAGSAAVVAAVIAILSKRKKGE